MVKKTDFEAVLNDGYATIHVLRYFAPGLINRDGAGNAKTAVIGGIERQRVSSQCWKYGMRKNQFLQATALKVGEEMSVRSTKHAELTIAPLLMERQPDIDAETAKKLADAALGFLFRKSQNGNGKDKTDAYDAAGTDHDSAAAAPAAKAEKSQMLCLGVAEIDAITTLCETAYLERMSPEDLRAGGPKPPKKAKKDKTAAKDKTATKGRDKGKAKDDLFAAALPADKSADDQSADEGEDEPTPELSDAMKKAVAAVAEMGRRAGYDGILFGRFATSTVMSTVTGAVAVSHMHTTHPNLTTSDFWSANDDKNTERGAGHVATAALGGGIFYGNLMMGLGQMKANLYAATTDALRESLRGLIHTIQSTDPSAKRGATGAHGEVIDIVVEIGQGPGLTASLAFEDGTAYKAKEATDTLLSYLDERQDRLHPDERPSHIIALSTMPKPKKGGKYEAFIETVIGAAIP
jgi:CRISPR system Cascade subunit CasC